MTADSFVIGIDTDLLKPKNSSLWRRWRRLSSFQKSFLVIFTIFVFVLIFQRHRQKATIHSEKPRVTEVDQPKDLIPVAINASRSNPDQGGESDQDRRPMISYPISGPTNGRQEAVVRAFLHSWGGYKRHAWGKDELLPITGSYSRWFGLGLTLVDSLDTMYLMGLKKEFDEARTWVAESLDLNVNSDVNLFECTIRVLGGLLSAYHLSADKIFLDKAEDLGRRLLPAFTTSSSPVPFSDVNLSSGLARNPSWGADSTTSEATSVQLEFSDLTWCTGDPRFGEAAMKVSRHVHSLPKRSGLVPIFINANSGQFRPSATITLGARGDSYYEYLLKMWLQTGNEMAKSDYLEAIAGVERLLMKETSFSKLLYVGELLAGSSFSPKMDHLVCFLGGNLALAAKNGLESKKFASMATRLTDTCLEFYRRMETGLSPEIVHFSTQILDSRDNEIFVKTADSHNLLRPETVESLFYLYRITGNKTYQDAGWEIFQAFEKYTKVKGGYTSIGNVRNPSNVQPRNKMESFWLSETLKYFYLLFSDDPNYVSLDEFVFNTEGHLLPQLRDSNRYHDDDSLKREDHE